MTGRPLHELRTLSLPASTLCNVMLPGVYIGGCFLEGVMGLLLEARVLGRKQRERC